jgi:hypothetical protein
LNKEKIKNKGENKMEINLKTKFNIGDTAFSKGFLGFLEVKILHIIVEVDEKGTDISYMTDSGLAGIQKEEDLYTEKEKSILLVGK